MKKLLKEIAFATFLPITLPVWLIRKVKRKRAMKRIDSTMAVFEHGDKAVDQHFQNIEVIGQKYAVAKASGDYFSKSMDNVIKACEEDIKLAPAYRKWYYKAGGKGNLPDYYSYKRLAVIYEKRKEYDKAIKVCNDAIAAGFAADGTEGGMPGRKAKLIQLKKQEAGRF